MASFPGAALTKTGGGLLTLSNNNTYTGATTVSAGTLAPSAPSSTNNIASSPLITVAAGAVLDASGLSSATLALAASQTLAGAGAVNGSLTLPPSPSSIQARFPRAWPAAARSTSWAA